ncbi:MAG: CoA pyrophosphatase [Myxococcota bacterium]
MRSELIEGLRAALTAHHVVDVPALPGRRNHRRAGILIPLVMTTPLTALMILRPSHLRDHAGEVAFPGGKPEPDDRDMAHTAVREANEELGLVDVDVLGRISSFPLYTSDYRLEPFIAALPPDPPMTPEPGEVAAVLRLDVEAVLAAPHVDAIPFKDMLSPVFTPAPGRHLYGGSAHAFLEVLDIIADVMGTRRPPMKPGRFTWDSFRRKKRSS